VKNRRLTALALAPAILLVAGCSSTPRPTPTRSPGSPTAASGGPTSCTQSWSLTPVLVPSGDDVSSTRLSGVAVAGPDDVWAVGSTASRGGTPQTLAEHWNGSAWAIVNAPDAGNARGLGGDALTAVSVVSPDDVWAVGYIGDPITSYVNGVPAIPVGETLVEHWDGTSWSIVTAPDVGSRDGTAPLDVLTAVDALGSADVYAVGVTEWPLQDPSFAPVAAQPLVEHWDGTRWSIIGVPDPEAAAPDWAISPPSAAPGPPPTQPPGAGPIGSAALLGVAAGSPDDVWLVGGYQRDAGYTTYSPSPWKTLTEHWDGTSWQIVDAPDATLPEEVNGTIEANDILAAADGAAAGGIWAVGGALPSSGLTLRLSGSTWKLVASPAVSVPDQPVTGSSPASPTEFMQGSSPLAAVASVTADDAWAVGAIIEHWDGSAWAPLYTLDGQTFGYLTGVATSPSSGLWAVGGTTVVHGTCA